ncbi:MAG: hypothetical protein JWQ11_2102 [Rhizobacter sp.]|nr:hypothetical protein [Rhizobacter sp.]
MRRLRRFSKKSIRLKDKRQVSEQEKKPRGSVGPASSLESGTSTAAVESSFIEVVGLIDQARHRALQSVNTQLVDLYWAVGRYISRKLAAAEWRDAVVHQLAEHIALTVPGQRGFSAQNMWRMRQFYDTYCTDSKLSPLVRVLPWTHNMVILGQAKRVEEREFYLRMATAQKWSKRELERQFRVAAFETAVATPAKLSPVVTQTHGEAAALIFKDNYTLEFLGLPADHSEADLHQGLLGKLQSFLIELGRDFCFVGSNYPLQVGSQDFALDLLFFHRALNCLVAIELKVGRFEPEHLGKLDFYLEALDRNVRKAHENPAIGVLLCASKDSEVVEYSMSRTLSPALVAQYRTQLPDRDLLAAKLHEFYELNAPERAG